VIKVHYLHIWKCHNESHYFVQLIYANKRDFSGRTINVSTSIQIRVSLRESFLQKKATGRWKQFAPVLTLKMETRPGARTCKECCSRERKAGKEVDFPLVFKGSSP
jgi:hypothetical protein